MQYKEVFTGKYNECEVKAARSDLIFPAFDEVEIISIDVGPGRPGPLVQLQLLKVATTTELQSHYCNSVNYKYVMHSN